MSVDLGVQTRRRLHHQGIPSSHAALVSRTATPAREGRPAADPPLVGRSVPAYVLAGRVVLVPAGYRAAPPNGPSAAPHQAGGAVGLWRGAP